MHGATYLFRRGSVYYYRRRVPDDLLGQFNGKQFIVFSLRTKEKSVAAALCRERAVEFDALIARAKLDASSMISLSLEAEQRVKPQKRAPAGIRSHSLVELASHWKALQVRHPKTCRELDAIVGRFAAHCGEKSVEAIRKSDFTKYRDQLLKDGRSTKTAEKHLAMLATLFASGVEGLWIPTNPALGVRVRHDRGAKKPRVPFSIDDLKKIFASPVYVANHRPAACSGEAAFWLPILALYTGARLGELGQLRREDVQLRGDIPVFHITDEHEGARLKSASSRRVVPVHPELVRIGFLDFANVAGEKLFPALKPDVAGVLTGLWSKWWGRYMRTTIGITDRRKTFHSFRHGFKDACREASVDEAVHDALTGHVGKSGVGRSYGSGSYPLRPLADAICKVEFPGLDLSGLRWVRPKG